MRAGLLTVPSARHRLRRMPHPKTWWADKLRLIRGLRQRSPNRNSSGEVRWVQATGNGDEVGPHGAIEIGPPELSQSLNEPSFFRDDALIDRAGPRKKSS